jgi:hypothetical protein
VRSALDKMKSDREDRWRKAIQEKKQAQAAAAAAAAVTSTED